VYEEGNVDTEHHNCPTRKLPPQPPPLLQPDAVAASLAERWHTHAARGKKERLLAALDAVQAIRGLTPATNDGKWKRRIALARTEALVITPTGVPSSPIGTAIVPP
jgi:hypothetical protein